MSKVNGQRSNVNFAFFGTDTFSVTILNELKDAGFIPSLVVTPTDKPKGRKMIITPPDAKVWATENNIPVLQPEKLDASFIGQLSKVNCQLFIVASFGKIIPGNILDIPKKGTLNVHPSLLPKLRGASPIQTSILENEDTGVTIMLMDEKMDHGPILAQDRLSESDIADGWPPTAQVLEDILAHNGGKLLAHVIPLFMNDKVTPIEQEHDEATFTKLIKKEDALIDLDEDPWTNYLKIQAYSGWPRAYFFVEKKRVVITSASFKEGKLIIEKVIPEGKKEMDYKSFVDRK
ncbi:methionyl-tRNA formyltransferase [Candidatus Wolfebacteria bacterium]|nr:MAG: methionyl-tRNA formyltransferase [Candidatus Wolfebacteria bacterium]